MLIVDDNSIFTWVVFLRNKSEEFKKFKIFKAIEKNQTECKIKCIRLDKEGEFTLDEFEDLCDEHGIKRHYTITETPQKNIVAKRQNIYFQEMVGAMM